MLTMPTMRKAPEGARGVPRQTDGSLDPPVQNRIAVAVHSVGLRGRQGCHEALRVSRRVAQQERKIEGHLPVPESTTP